MVAEYERAKILERSRRGKLHAARQGSVNVLSGAPYGYRYISCREGDGEARYEIVLEEARVIRQMFEWVGRDGLSIGEVCRRLKTARHPFAEGQELLGPNDRLGPPEEPGVPGNGDLRQDARLARKGRVCGHNAGVRSNRGERIRSTMCLDDQGIPHCRSGDRQRGVVRGR